MAPKEKVNILLVDDQPAKLLSLETILADLDENIVKANSADEALKFLLHEECAVVLVDVCMPNIDGFELAELVRAHPRFGRTAIIFISAVYLTDADRLRGYDLGAVDYMPVPIVPEVLRAKVAVFTELYRKTTELRRVNAELSQSIRELNQSNERLRFADRMATIGTLAAGLGHDMGNLLLPVRMRLEALETGDLSEQAREDIAAIREAAEYLQRLARSLRMLAIDPSAEAIPDEATDLSQWWIEAEGLLRSAVSRPSTLSAVVAAGLPRVFIGRAGLTQVVFNLVQNAADALRDRKDGKIVIAAREVPGSVMLSVIDNGPGMSDEARRRCLEPYYTTKIRELSTGLGLTLVNGVMERAGGKLHIESEMGRGSTITLEIPSALGNLDQTEGSRVHAVAAVSLSDPLLRAHVRSILESFQCEVRDAGAADAVLLITQANGGAGVDAARQFAASRTGRCAIVFGGETPEDPAGRLVCLDPGIKPSSLRRRIGDALALCEIEEGTRA